MVSKRKTKGDLYSWRIDTVIDYISRYLNDPDDNEIEYSGDDNDDIDDKIQSINSIFEKNVRNYTNTVSTTRPHGANSNVTLVNILPRNSSTFHDTNNTFIEFLENVFHIRMVPALASFAAICLLVLLVLFILCLFIWKRRRTEKQKSQNFKNLLEDYPNLDAIDGALNALFGQLEYSLEYKLSKQQLKITVIQAVDLQCPQGICLDPYVVVSLEPPDANMKKMKRQKTKVVRNSQNPVFNETFTFPVSYQEIPGKTVVLDIFDQDDVGQDGRFAQLKVALWEVDIQLFLDKVHETTGILSEGDKMQIGKGDVCLILKCIPDQQKFCVTVLEFKELQVDPRKMHRRKEIFIEAELKVGAKLLDKKHSSSRQDIKNPYFEELFVFKVLAEKLPHATLIVKALYPGVLPGMKVCIGMAKLGYSFAGTSEAGHWKDMIKNPKRPVAMWHTLWPEEMEN